MHIKSKDSWLKHIDFILWDIVVLFISFILANLIYLHRLNYYSSTLYTIIFLCMLIPILFIDLLYNPYSGVLRRDSATEVRNGFEYLIFDLIFSIVLLYIFKLGNLFSRVVFILTYIIYFILVTIVRIIWKRLIITGKVSIFSGNNSLLIISSSKDIKNVLDNINKEEYHQYDIKGLCIIDKNNKGRTIKNYKVLCNSDGIYECVMNNYIGEVFIATNPNEVDAEVVKNLIDEGVGIHVDINKIYGFEADDEHIDKVGIYKTLGLGLYTFTSRQTFYLFIKRIFDLIISLFVMVPLILIILIVKIAYLLDGDKTSVIFKQTRVGKDGKLFDIYKFRTMVPDAEEILKDLLKDEKNRKEWDEYHKLENDPRITKIGKFLRKTSLDELPQFINVLKADMSMIGPRPLIPGELKMHNGLRLYERIRPGITGWWACNGRSNISYDERLELEYYYVKNCSLTLDIFIIFRTIFSVIKRTGAE